MCSVHWYDKSLEQETDYRMQEIPAIELEREPSSSPNPDHFDNPLSRWTVFGYS
jgi:hypothetical protein